MSTVVKTRWERRVDKICDRLREIASDAETSDPHGTDDENCSDLLCDDCAGPDHYSLRSWSLHWDSQQHCEKCSKQLDHFFADYGVKEEVSTSAELTGPIKADEAFTLLNCIDSGHPKLTCICGDFEYLPELKPQLREIEKRLNGKK